jgi:dCTP deaminase
MENIPGSVMSDKSIKKALADKDLKIEGYEPLYVGPSSVDLHLGNECQMLSFDRRNWLTDTKDKDTIVFKKFFFKELIVCPNEFYLVSTKENITLGKNMVGFLQGRSSLARLGLNVHCAGFFDAGFSGTATLELTNFTKKPIVIYEDMRICQMVFVKTDSVPEVSYGEKKDQKYQGQIEPTLSKIHEDN